MRARHVHASESFSPNRGFVAGSSESVRRFPKRGAKLLERFILRRRALGHAAMGWTPQPYTGACKTSRGRNRVCFTLQFETSDLCGYLKDHEAVWPEMQAALVECGWHNYSLFYRKDGFAVGYFETDEDFATACKRMDAYAVNTKWQAAMSKYVPAGKSPLDGGDTSLAHYFYIGEDAPGATPPYSAWLAAGVAIGFGLSLAATRLLRK